ncbi:MAG: hypothetical protein M3Y72_08795 [Acidobacteriota bacterium]|nr:hypothetical protein [Acidobacteriota bacterium]
MTAARIALGCWHSGAHLGNTFEESARGVVVRTLRHELAGEGFRENGLPDEYAWA